MNKTAINRLILKLIDNTISETESEALAIWLESDDENLKYFNELIQVNYLIDSKQEFNHNESLNRILNTTQRKRRFSKKTWLYSVAASITILLAVTFTTYKYNTTNSKPIIVNNNIDNGTNKATLTIEDGSSIVLEKGQDYVASTGNIISNGEEIIYETKKTNLTKTAYNTLTIPRGGQFFLKLADGTQVWFNSETQLKYPVNFIDGETRQVELVYGEAYFKVSHSTEHGGSSFKVLNDGQEIEVLGTEFNIKAYKDEANLYTTLVTGKVAVSTDNTSTILKPGEQSNLNSSTKDFTVTTVDVYDQISWKEGIFSFKRKSLKNIMQVLSRWYDMDVTFENKALENIGFNGALGKDQNIQEILETIKGSGVIKNYEINNKQVILK
ncbi:FecR family protein [Thalassobellus citreus]|uniref:FecR family protein n=1 Tax=Thalassobellus citreus TaxID=3367752 RepID=UPI0037BAE1E1